MAGRRPRREFSTFVFPAGARGRSRFEADADGQQHLVYDDRHMAGTQHNACERIRARVGIADFTPHDLRRTAGTAMAQLGVPRFIVERVLNHTDRTVTSVYDRYSYSTEKMAAVRKLGAFVERMATRHRTQARHDPPGSGHPRDRRVQREIARSGVSPAMSSVHRSPPL
jgi:integrase